MFYRILSEEKPALVVCVRIEYGKALIGVRRLTSEGWDRTSFIGCEIADLDDKVEVVKGGWDLIRRLHEKAQASGVSYAPLTVAFETQSDLFMWPMIESS